MPKTPLLARIRRKLAEIAQLDVGSPKVEVRAGPGGPPGVSGSASSIFSPLGGSSREPSKRHRQDGAGLDEPLGDPFVMISGLRIKADTSAHNRSRYLVRPPCACCGLHRVDDVGRVAGQRWSRVRWLRSLL